MSECFNINMISSKPNRAKLYLKILKEAVKPIIIFASGSVGRSYYRTLVKHGVEISCFADNSEKKIGCDINIDGKSMKVISFRDILNYYPNAYIVVASRICRAEIMEQFINAGYDKQNLITVEFGINDYNIREHIVSNYEMYKKSYALLNDDQSRNVFINKLNFLNTGEDEFIERMRSDGVMYFDSEMMRLSECEAIIDGGGFTGDTFKEFINIAKTFERYYLCEPDPDNICVAENNLFAYETISYVPMGLWSKKDILKFSAAESGASSINSRGNISIKVISIDELTEGKPVSLIKMDIEGAEIEALKGAAETIRQHKPKLAICVYHKLNDIFEIPLFIKELNPEYKIYLRHYSVGMVDTICYAI